MKLGQCEQLSDDDVDKETAVSSDISRHLSPPIEVSQSTTLAAAAAACEINYETCRHKLPDWP